MFTFKVFKHLKTNDSYIVSYCMRSFHNTSSVTKNNLAAEPLRMLGNKRRVFVVGVGMTKFEKPGRRENFDYPDMVLEAATKALQDAKVDFKSVQQAYAGYCYGDSTCGQRAIYQLGLTGIPIFNVNNNCSTGSSALMLAKQAIQGGIADCVMAVGFEKMEKGSIGMKYTDRTNPLDKHIESMMELYDVTASPMTCQLFGNAGTKPEHFAKIAWKNHKHSTNNPNSQFQDEYTLDQIMNSPSVHDFLTKLQCCPTSDGSACAILASQSFVEKHSLQSQSVEIIGQAMSTDLSSTFNDKDAMKIVGYDMTRNAADQAYKEAGVTANDVQVIELHDCFSANELITYEALGLSGELIDSGNNTYGGKYVVNPSGGLISKGHPLGATGLAQCTELCWQLRGLADKRQVGGAKIALQHNVGLGGAVVITIYKLGYPELASEGRRFQIKSVFDAIENELEKKGEELTKKVNGIFCFKVASKNGEGTWVLDAKNGKGSVKFDPEGTGDVTLTVDDDNLFSLMIGKLNPQQAFFQGKLKIKGNMGLAMKLQQIMPKDFKSKL
ncbi:hypothetical protein HELRODRAFT_181809 [Helobdella robusta]|uniref:Sterol carrier protein 2 n=1 Tax=Helobdella robusta TaxID=6412 RepID=T1FHC9_HELRO|nr:hypothetical protein HELRODRAFT_181809 [Helobdella robusta]ESN92033.1 hypothetical protein HELRODRAFT_181809 [Helobdella robusta]